MARGDASAAYIYGEMEHLEMEPYFHNLNQKHNLQVCDRVIHKYMVMSNYKVIFLLAGLGNCYAVCESSTQLGNHTSL